ncbi:hypothetical protein AX16_003476 [Volvariella volvacea WC 439]|nr:hypothetical protein AX16_003476 [Volvariella volvacea WC 439]
MNTPAVSALRLSGLSVSTVSVPVPTLDLSKGQKFKYWFDLGDKEFAFQSAPVSKPTDRSGTSIPTDDRETVEDRATLARILSAFS